MCRILLYLLFTFSTLTFYGQEVYFEEPAKFITQFTFKQLIGGVILVKAKFNNITEPFNFILDTGSGAISLDSSTTAEFKIPHEPSGRTISGIAGIRKVDYAKNNSLTFPGLKVDSLDFYINDYNILSSVYGEKIDGIIGYTFFHKFIVKINFDSLYIQIFSPGRIQYPSKGTLLTPLFTALPIQSLTIKDARKVVSNFYFDTGAGLNFLISKQFEKDSSFLLKRRRPVSIQAQGLGGKMEMLLTIIKRIKIGSYKFKKVPTDILDDEYNAISYPFISGLIGDDILRRFNMIINYPNREIYLSPNSHFNDKFDYSYTGINMYFADGAIFSDEVIKGSPAYKAGLKKDDIIMGINNNFSNNITVYKNLMQNVGEKVTLLVMRDKTPFIISFRVGRIFKRFNWLRF
ncbi:MAG: aspartyl protease family protein [Bacteroidota bacterium]|nr:aspartyl protease family protein [Bacteroidota bacterium]